SKRDWSSDVCSSDLPENVHNHELFKEPGLKQIGDNEYQLTVVASAFDYDVGTDDKVVQIPKGATVHISSTTTDVIHGFEIAGTKIGRASCRERVYRE